MARQSPLESVRQGHADSRVVRMAMSGKEPADRLPGSSGLWNREADQM